MGADRILSVTPASSYNLIDLNTIKSFLNITDTSQDDYLNLVIPQASASVANYCNRNLVVEAVVAAARRAARVEGVRGHDASRETLRKGLTRVDTGCMVDP